MSRKVLKLGLVFIHMEMWGKMIILFKKKDLQEHSKYELPSG